MIPIDQGYWPEDAEPIRPEMYMDIGGNVRWDYIHEEPKSEYSICSECGYSMPRGKYICPECEEDLRAEGVTP